MKVKIIKSCSDRNWYKNEIGNIFYVGKSDKDGDCRVLDDADLGRYIAEEDFIILDDWSPLEVDNLPSDILTGDYEVQEINSRGEKIRENNTVFDAIRYTYENYINKNNRWNKYRYRLRPPEAPTVEELAEKFSDANIEGRSGKMFIPVGGFKGAIKEAYIAGYKEAKGE